MKYSEEQDTTLEMIIEAGLLKPGVVLYAESDNSIEAILNANGSLSVQINGENKTFPYPSGAARAIRNISVSGWKFWKVKVGERLVDLLEFKQNFKTLRTRQ